MADAARQGCEKLLQQSLGCLGDRATVSTNNFSVQAQGAAISFVLGPCAPRRCHRVPEDLLLSARRHPAIPTAKLDMSAAAQAHGRDSVSVRVGRRAQKPPKTRRRGQQQTSGLIKIWRAVCDHAYRFHILSSNKRDRAQGQHCGSTCVQQIMTSSPCSVLSVM